MIKMTGAAAVGATVLGIPVGASAQDNGNGSLNPRRRLKVLAIGAHPADPETCCGGTMCLFADAGHDDFLHAVKVELQRRSVIARLDVLHLLLAVGGHFDEPVTTRLLIA
jgi:hypothetical protein